MVQHFEIPVIVQPEDIDELGHVNNVVYLKWVQEAATAHWRAAATPEEQADLFWVVTRHEIDYIRPAFPADTIAVRTWVGDSTRGRFDRHTEIRRTADDRVLARVRSVWCPMDRSTGRPAAVGDEVRARWSTRE